MNYETIEQTIELLCEKFGIVIGSVASLIPAVAQYNIIIDIIWAILGAAIFVGTLLIIAAHWNKIKDEDAEWPAIIVGCIPGVFGGMMCLDNIMEIVKWSTIPELAFVEYIANYIA